MKQKTAEAMRPIVESYAQYKGSKKAFCREHGLAIHTLDYWRHKFKGSQRASSGFIALKVDAGSSSQTIELRYPNGVRAILPLEISVEVLQNLITLAC